MTKQESVNGETWKAKAGNFDDYLQPMPTAREEPPF